MLVRVWGKVDCWCKFKLVHLWGKMCQYSIKISNAYTLCTGPSPTSGIDPEIYLHKNEMLHARGYSLQPSALFVTAENWKQPKMENWLNEVQCIFTMERHAAIGEQARQREREVYRLMYKELQDRLREKIQSTNRGIMCCILHRYSRRNPPKHYCFPWVGGEKGTRKMRGYFSMYFNKCMYFFYTKCHI